MHSRDVHCNGGTTPGGITGRGFLPGQSGNPGGRRRGLARMTREKLGHEGEAIVDLPAYYGLVRRRFWLLFAAHWTVSTGVSLWAQVRIGGAHLDLRSPAFLLIPGAIALAFIKARWVHVVCMLFLIVLYLTQLAGHHLVTK